MPAGYTGTPYQGTPQAIPGRVELADLDEGGVNVAFWADHRRENAVAEGYSPISGDDYRPGNLDLPNICKTNRALEVMGQGSEDFWEDGKRYPSDQDLYVYYMGYAHTVDWVRVTVNVQQAGTYNVSSSWACANPNCGLSIWFNDGASNTDNPDRPLDGENKTGTVMLEGTNDYHKWRAYPNFAQVELSAGEQLMTFHVEVADHLQYGYLQFDLVGGQAGGGTGGSAGASGMSGGGVGGGMGSAGMASTGGSPAAGSPSDGAGGTAAMMGAAGTTPGAGSTPALTSSDTGTDAGCSVASSSASTRAAGGASWLGLLLGLALAVRRRPSR